MLIDQQELRDMLKTHGIEISGVLHIGAHECEEMPFYTSIGVSPDTVIWIDALEEKVAQAKRRGVVNMYQAVITDKDDETVTFHVTNNVQSSSILDFGTHARNHPSVRFVRDLTLTTVTVDTFIHRNGIDPSKLNLWNFDIQGAEMLALRGATDALKYAKVLYLEVNTEEVYKGCAIRDELDAYLGTHGFTRVLTKMWSNAGWGDSVYIRM
jgi:FkbM family methyltransferase